MAENHKMRVAYAVRKGLAPEDIAYLAPESLPRFRSDQCVVLAEYIQELEARLEALSQRVGWLDELAVKLDADLERLLESSE